MIDARIRAGVCSLRRPVGVSCVLLVPGCSYEYGKYLGGQSPFAREEWPLVCSGECVRIAVVFMNLGDQRQRQASGYSERPTSGDAQPLIDTQELSTVSAMAYPPTPTRHTLAKKHLI
jgi:hypothetical protein